jgi:hypothetical protein
MHSVKGWKGFYPRWKSEETSSNGVVIAEPVKRQLVIDVMLLACSKARHTKDNMAE